nr:PREDICTED: uncharacterized protein LOC109036118 [Bemisia tabaci]
MAALPGHVLPSYFACVVLVTNIALASTGPPVENVDLKNSEPYPQVPGADDGVHSLQPRGLFDSLGLTSLFGSVFSGFSNLDKNPGGGSSGLTNLKIQSGGGPGSSLGESLQVSSQTGIVLRMFKSGKNEPIRFRNNKVYEGENMVCADREKFFPEPKYQKSVGGGRWHTNIQVGEPMSQPEIDQFEADWAKVYKNNTGSTAGKKGQNLEGTNSMNARGTARLAAANRLMRRRSSRGSESSSWW